MGNINRNYELNVGIVFAVFFTFITLLIGYQTNNDLWFILSVGREIEAYGGIYPKDMLSMHSNMDVVLQQWLYAIIAWKLYTFTGSTFIIWLISLVSGFITIYLFYKIAYMISDNKWISMYLTIIVGFFLCPYIVTRPYTITNMLVMIELFILEQYALNGKKSSLYILPFISMLLINLHGAMWIGFACVAVVYMFDFISPAKFMHSKYSGKPVLISLVLSVLLAMVNPYGINMLGYVIQSLGSNHAIVSKLVNEMAPLSIDNSIFLPTVTFMTILIVGYARHKAPVRYLLLSIGVSFLVISAVRGFPQFLLLACLPIAYLFRNAILPEPFYNIRLLKVSSILIVSILSIVYITCVDKNAIRRDGTCWHDVSYNTILQHSKEHNEEIILYAEYESGAYAEFLGLKPYIDPRAEAFVTDINHDYDYLREYAREIGRAHV